MSFVRPKLTGPDLQIRDSVDMQKYGYRFDQMPTYLYRIATVDEMGVPIEETISSFAKAERFVDPAGNICMVPLQTGRVLSHEPEAEKYENYIRRDLITTGWLPMAECPHTKDYRAITRRDEPLVPIPAGESACAGKEGGCDHLWKLVEKRQAVSRKRWENQQFKKDSMTIEQALEMAERLGQGMAGNGMKASRDALKNGKGEKE